HPPGLYGPPEGLLAVNALAPDDRLAPLDLSALNARREAYRMSEPEDLRGPILLGALALLALDALVVFLLAGGIGQLVRRRRPPASGTSAAGGGRRWARSRSQFWPRRCCRRRGRSRRRMRSRPCDRRSRPASPTSSPATPRSTASARPDFRASPCSSRNAPRSRRASRSGSIPRAARLPSIRRAIRLPCGGGPSAAATRQSTSP